MRSLSVVICAYNEAANLYSVTEEVLAVLKRISDPFEIIFINDGSTDSTAEIMSKLATEKSCIQICTHARKSGMGASLRDGYKLARYDYVSYLPADGQINSQDLEKFLTHIGGHDFIFSYYRKRPEGLLRKAMSKSVRFILFVLFGRTPPIDGTYLFKRTMLDHFQLISSSFVLNWEFVIRASRKGFTYQAVETECRSRLTGKSKVANIKQILQVFRELFYLRINMMMKN